MASSRLSPLDAVFLEVEGPAAHMHVGWAAVFDPPEKRSPPTFEQVRDHVGRRLRDAPRYRQRLADVPFGLARPVWVDDERFDLDRHVRRVSAGSLGELAAAALSVPLSRARPLWELWITESLEDGRIGMVGKAHHCMVDGVAALGLAGLLLDPVPETLPAELHSWTPRPAPPLSRLLVEGVIDRVREQLDLVGAASRTVASPGRLAALPAEILGIARALSQAAAPAPAVPGISERLSPYRHLALHSRPLDEVRRVKDAFGVTVNDVVLAVCCGAMRRLLSRQGVAAAPLKAMVPVNVRGPDGAEALGNRIAPTFLALPCHEPDPVVRLRAIHAATCERKKLGVPQHANAVIRLVGAAPATVQRAVTRLSVAPRAFNLSVSNVAGPTEPLYLLGCPISEVYPAAPIADGHALSVTFMTLAGRGCFGVYVDRDALPEADLIADDLGKELDELLRLVGERTGARNGRRRGVRAKANGSHGTGLHETSLQPAPEPGPAPG